MAENNDDFDDVEGGENDSNLVKDLRKQLAAAKKESAEAAKIVADFQKTQKTEKVAAALSAHANDDSERARLAKLAKFYDRDTAEKSDIDEWLSEHADVFGIDLGNEGDEETNEQVQRVTEATKSKPKGLVQGTPEWVAHMFATKSDSELIEAGLLRTR